MNMQQLENIVFPTKVITLVGKGLITDITGKGFIDHLANDTQDFSIPRATLIQADRQQVIRLMWASGYNKNQIAQLFGISRERMRQIVARMEKYGQIPRVVKNKKARPKLCVVCGQPIQKSNGNNKYCHECQSRQKKVSNDTYKKKIYQQDKVPTWAKPLFALAQSGKIYSADELIPYYEAAEILQVTIATIYMWINKGLFSRCYIRVKSHGHNQRTAIPKEQVELLSQSHPKQKEATMARDIAEECEVVAKREQSLREMNALATKIQCEQREEEARKKEGKS